MAPQMLAGSQSCGASRCHFDIYRKCAADSHRWSSEDVAFQGVQAALVHAEGAPPALFAAPFPRPGKALPGTWSNSRRQRCRIFGLILKARATSATDAPISSRCSVASLNFLVNYRRDKLVTQSSSEWHFHTIR